MSIAGIRSNRGDGYQTLVALEWALFVLSDQDFEWIEIDAVSLPVDDVVVGKCDGKRICIQCKKNQKNFDAWTVTDLADELKKARDVLASDPRAEVRFYSRSPFGAIAKLREHSIAYPNEVSFQNSLTPEHKRTNGELEKVLGGTSSFSTYEFLQRLKFETSPELDRMQALLRERLRYLLTSPDVAFDVLWRRLDHLGARIEGTGQSSVQHRLTKDDIKVLLHQAGSMLVPIMSLDKVRTSFSGISAVGRIWQREVGGVRIASPTVDALLKAVEEKKRSILLTGLPGAGKTCLLLEMQERLEQLAAGRSDLVPLFIQAREYADFDTVQEREAQGLPAKWVEEVARMAEEAHVVILIDSLDVLSIAREHKVLTYFLAQIDRLLPIPNVTVVTACRDFDRHYDRRIAERTWEVELKCTALDWDADVEPLLQGLNIDTKTIDAVTRELIRNPRELALFVELAVREGTFNVVTSQALAQRYLDSIVRKDAALGDDAMQAIETLAAEMLRLRSLSVSRQRFTASQEVERALLSKNVLRHTQDGKLTFGHQTLLDVLVISGALRKGITLAEFIRGLPPVPFVRPSIRSFITQLAIGERPAFRKQLRTVLTGDSAFHIRRLVAESLAEQKPQDEDWRLLRDLRDKNKEVFQVIYLQATSIDWHYFWLEHLVPALKDEKDVDGLYAHVHRVSHWKNVDSTGVLEFWSNVLALDWIDASQISRQIALHLADINVENFALLVPLANRLLTLPRQEHSFLGKVVARCVSTGEADDAMLWRFIEGEIKDSDALALSFGDKLRCQAHDFGDRNDNFFSRRMAGSPELLDLAVRSVERWSQVRISQKGPWMAGRMGFLSHTSYEDAHSERDVRHVSSERVLFDAMESAILQQAVAHSPWWQANRERLCFSQEGALRYFAILACTESPIANGDVIGRMLCNKDFLLSDLSYEFGSLMHAASIYLESDTLSAVLNAILTLEHVEDASEAMRFWIAKAQIEYISAIPCHLRSTAAQLKLDVNQKAEGVFIRSPDVRSRGGIVGFPFSYNVLLNATDEGVSHLLSHYAGYSSFDSHDFLLGGEREVGGQLREAASRQPLRFLGLLNKHWNNTSERFRNDIMEGVANHLAYLYGDLHSNDGWTPVDRPNAISLSQTILDELDRHPAHWRNNRAASNALQACANVIDDSNIAARLVFQAVGFEHLREHSPILGDQVDFVAHGINMKRGHVAEALMIVVTRLLENGSDFPELLLPTLRRFAADDDPAIRALVLRRLPYLQYRSPELGWQLYELATRSDMSGLWEVAEPCLYYAYREHFGKIASSLTRIRTEGFGKDLETWGRISALAAFYNCIDFLQLLKELKDLDVSDAWRGAASVWTNAGNLQSHHGQCIAGIEAGLNAGSEIASTALAHAMNDVFRNTAPPIYVPIQLIQRCFTILENSNEKQNHIFGFDDWINAMSQRNPELALAGAQAYFDYAGRTKAYIYDHDNNFTQLLTRLFAEAEEREESDAGEMLQQVVALQDSMLSLGIDGVNDWLKAAERP